MRRFTDKPNEGAELDKLIAPIDNFTNWVIPSFLALEKEYNIEYKNHIEPMFGIIWPTLKDFIAAANIGEVATLTNRMDLKTINRSHTRTMQDLVSLISNYKSWPQYRNVNTLTDMIIRFKENQPMTMPIILKFGRELFLMSGNTKLDIAKMMKITPQVLIITI